MGAIPFDEILGRMDPERQARIKARSAKLIAREYKLREIRELLSVSQGQVAQTLGVEQAAVSKMERRGDMYVSNLRKYIRAMGGDLEIIARFPGHDPVIVSQLDGQVIKPAKRGRKPKPKASETT